MNKKLSIVIPTYNRKECLLKQLKSLYKQPNVNDISIVICDNHSNYNVKEFIINEFGLDTISNLEVIVNKYNLGMYANLALIFLHCKTKWMWTLSDDDETLDNSISTILDDIDNFPSTSMFKYSIEGFNPYEDKTVNSLSQFIQYYLNGRYSSGDMIFLSNNVYNMTIVSKYYGNTLSYCYCAIAHLLPAFFALDNNDAIVHFRPQAIVSYNEVAHNTGWNLKYGAISISSISLFPFNLSDKEFKKLGSLVIGCFNHYTIIFDCLSEPDRRHGKYLYLQIYNRSYRYSRKLYDKLLYMIFRICYFLHIEISHETASKVKHCFIKTFC